MNPKDILARLAESGTPPDRESALRISVGLDETIDRFRNETLPFIAAGGAELQFAFAPYGRGKTHFLRTLQEVARQQGLVTAYVDCRSGQAPFASLQETYRAIAGNLLPVGNNAPSAHRVGPEAVIEEALASLPATRSQERIAALQQDGSLTSDYRNIVVAYCRTILTGQHYGALGNDLRSMLRSDPSTRIRVSDLYRAHTWLPRPLGKLGRRNAAAWLRSLGSMPRALGYPGLAILLDETEQLHSLHALHSRQRRLHLANLRNFVDHLALGSFGGCVIYYAVVEEFLEAAQVELEALTQRIERIRLGNRTSARNPRAIWVDLDELTHPDPENSSFYDQLGQRITMLGIDAGIPQDVGHSIAERLRGESATFSNSINVGAVRDFVKMAASLVAREVSLHA